MTQPIPAVALCLLTAVVLAGCGKNEEPAPKPAAQVSAAPPSAPQVAEMRKLVEETKRYAQSVKPQAAANPASAEQLSQLPALLEQLLRHVQERDLASQQGGDVAKPEAQIAEDLQRIEQVQGALPGPGAEQPGTPPTAGGEKSPLDLVSENLAKITGMVQQGKAIAQQGKDVLQQGKELAAIVRPAKRQGGEPEANPMQTSEPQASEPQASAPQASEPQASEPQASEPQASEPRASPPQAPEQAAKEAVVSVVAATKPAVAKTPEVFSAGSCCTMVPNPAMKGRLGRLVVTYPEGTNAGARVEVFMGDKRATYDHGNQAFELLPGNYSVVISGKRVDNVTVQSRHDTKVKVGVLRVTAPGGTRIEVLDQDGKRLTYDHGNKQFGLPIGKVYVQVHGQKEAVAIEDGKITDF